MGLWNCAPLKSWMHDAPDCSPLILSSLTHIVKGRSFTYGKGAFVCHFSSHCVLINVNWTHGEDPRVFAGISSPPAQFSLPPLEFIKGETLLTKRTGASIQHCPRQTKGELRYKSDTYLSWFKLCNLFSLLVLWLLVCLLSLCPSCSLTHN